MHSLGLTKLYVADDGTPYGATIAAEVRAAAAKQGLSVAAGAASADAVFYGGNTAARGHQGARPGRRRQQRGQAVRSLRALRRRLRGRPERGRPEEPVRVLARLHLGTLSPAGQQFVTAFRSAYGHAPVPQAIFGYEAMSAVLAVLKQAGAEPAAAPTVVSDFRSLHNRQSALGTYSISAGDTSLAPFVFGRPRERAARCRARRADVSDERRRVAPLAARGLVSVRRGSARSLNSDLEVVGIRTRDYSPAIEGTDSPVDHEEDDFL